MKTKCAISHEIAQATHFSELQFLRCVTMSRDSQLDTCHHCELSVTVSSIDNFLKSRMLFRCYHCSDSNLCSLTQILESNKLLGWWISLLTQLVWDVTIAARCCCHVTSVCQNWLVCHLGGKQRVASFHHAAHFHVLSCCTMHNGTCRLCCHVWQTVPKELPSLWHCLWL